MRFTENVRQVAKEHAHYLLPWHPLRCWVGLWGRGDGNEGVKGHDSWLRHCQNALCVLECSNALYAYIYLINSFIRYEPCVFQNKIFLIMTNSNRLISHHSFIFVLTHFASRVTWSLLHLCIFSLNEWTDEVSSTGEIMGHFASKWVKIETKLVE